MTPILECNHFSFSIGKERLLEDISFKINACDWLSIIGPNGSGKSTLLKNMLRLVAGRSDGEIRLKGKPINSYSQKELARILAYVPQAGGLLPPFTVREFVNLSRYPFDFKARSSGKSDCVEEALILTNTAHLADKRLDKLSGGQRQRAFLAAALAQDTDILLLDEPASFLDPRHAYTLNKLLKRLHSEKGLTIVTVSHDLSMPLEAGGMTLALQNGKQLYFGPSENLVENTVLEKTFKHNFSYLPHPKTGKTVVLA